MMGLYMYSSQGLIRGVDASQLYFDCFQIIQFQEGISSKFSRGYASRPPSKSMLSVVRRTMQARPTLSNPTLNFIAMVMLMIHSYV